MKTTGPDTHEDVRVGDNGRQSLTPHAQQKRFARAQLCLPRLHQSHPLETLKNPIRDRGIDRQD